MTVESLVLSFILLRQMKKRNKYIIGLITGLFIIVSCQRSLVPRPRGFFRVDLPEQRNYQNISEAFPYSFQVNEITRFSNISTAKNPYWANLVYDTIGAIIHLSYLPVQDNLYALLEDSRSFVYKHADRADAINQNVFAFPERNVYGIVYDLKGNAASPMQFVTTDSINHFVRGVLYFKSRANQDSLKPMIEYVEKDIQHLIETFQWK